MKRRLFVLVVLLAGCPSGPKIPSNQPDADAKAAVARLVASRQAVTSFNASSTMDFKFGAERLKTGVLVMGMPGAKVRINALNPMGDSVIADLACDGTTFYYRDVQNNCELTGPCTRDSIANLLHVVMQPDDFLYLAAGTPPIIDGIPTLTWDANRGRETIEISGAEGKQTIVIDARDNHADVIDSELKGPDGKILWSVENKEFKDFEGHRVPGRSRFRAETADNDLVSEWKEVHVNAGKIDDAKFKFDLIGLKRCGS